MFGLYITPWLAWCQCSVFDAEKHFLTTTLEKDSSKYKDKKFNCSLTIIFLKSHNFFYAIQAKPYLKLSKRMKVSWNLQSWERNWYIRSITKIAKSLQYFTQNNLILRVETWDKTTSATFIAILLHFHPAEYSSYWFL